jgi:hypothetical protein
MIIIWMVYKNLLKLYFEWFRNIYKAQILNFLQKSFSPVLNNLCLLNDCVFRGLDNRSCQDLLNLQILVRIIIWMVYKTVWVKFWIIYKTAPVIFWIVYIFQKIICCMVYKYVIKTADDYFDKLDHFDLTHFAKQLFDFRKIFSQITRKWKMTFTLIFDFKDFICFSNFILIQVVTVLIYWWTLLHIDIILRVLKSLAVYLPVRPWLLRGIKFFHRTEIILNQISTKNMKNDSIEFLIFQRKITYDEIMRLWYYDIMILWTIWHIHVYGLVLNWPLSSERI